MAGQFSDDIHYVLRFHTPPYMYPFSLILSSSQSQKNTKDTYDCRGGMLIRGCMN
jgi:hypothetical protein